MPCVFCRLPQTSVIDENDLALAFYDLFPVTKYHTLIIPKRHVADYFDLTPEEIDGMHALLLRQKERVLKEDASVTGFNIGVNVGEDAGQSVFHVHMHLIPRRRGDAKSPKGGVRGVIPEKHGY